ncbi:hypothetical protein LTR53_020201, partial [Teratosphaeriaceae sp. CCFEE 6253]
MSFKRPRSASPNARGGAATPGPGHAEAKSAASPAAMQRFAENGHRTLMWEEDPYAVDPDTTTHLLSLYFAHVNDATYTLYPRNTFMR